MTVLFAAAAAVVLATIAFLMYRLGLPDWVLWGGAVLLIVGLPIMLVTGLHERRRARASTTAVSLRPAETIVSRHFTWRKALLGGGLAFAGLTTVAGAYTAMRLLGIGPVGTLVASGALAERDRLILANFENRTADSTLAGSLTEALRVDLSQSPTVRLVDAADDRRRPARMQRPPDAALTPTLAREVAERSGAKAVVTGQIDPVGGGYVLSANLVAAADGGVLTSVRETADEPAALLGAIDRLSAKLRERIGESLVSIRANPPLEQVTTSSLAALRKYSEGSRQIDLGFPEGAIPVLEEAIALDTGFAMAYRKLAVAIGNSFGSASREAVATTRAYELRDRLPATERELATAYYFDNVEHDPARVASAYRSILDRDPEQDIALNNLALLSILERRYAEAESLAVRALRVGSASQYFFQALNAQVAQGRLVEARATLKRLTEFYPAGSVPRLDLASDLALAERNYAVADSLNRQLREAQRASPEWQARTSTTLAALAETRGRLAEAAAHRRDYMAVSELRRLPQDYLRGAAELAQIELRYRNRPREALAIVQTALARHPLDSLPPADRPYLALAELHAVAGRPEQARRLLGEYERTVPAGQRRAVRRAGLSYGRVAEAEGKLAEAAEAYRDAYARTGYLRELRPARARRRARSAGPGRFRAGAVRALRGDAHCARADRRGAGGPRAHVQTPRRALRGEGRSREGGRLLREVRGPLEGR